MLRTLRALKVKLQVEATLLVLFCACEELCCGAFVTHEEKQTEN
jgi:hypothetical protein